MPHKSTIILRCEDDLKDSLDLLAREKGVTVSAYIRRALWDIVEAERVFRHVNGDNK